MPIRVPLPSRCVAIRTRNQAPTEGVVETTAGAILSPSLDEPAKLLAAIAVEVAVGVDQVPMRSALHDCPLSRVPPTPVASSDARAKSGLASDHDSFRPCHDPPLRCLRLRQVEISAEDAWRGGRPGYNGHHRLQHLDLFPSVAGSRRDVLVCTVTAPFGIDTADESMRSGHGTTCPEAVGVRGNRLAMTRPYLRGPTTAHVADKSKLSTT